MTSSSHAYTSHPNNPPESVINAPSSAFPAIRRLPSSPILGPFSLGPTLSPPLSSPDI